MGIAWDRVPAADIEHVADETLVLSGGKRWMGTVPAKVAAQVSNQDNFMTAENARIQTLRGLACLLIVIFHVMGNTPNSGLLIYDVTALRQ